MTCSNSVFEISSKFPVYWKVYALVQGTGKSSNICFDQLLETWAQFGGGHGGRVTPTFSGGEV